MRQSPKEIGDLIDLSLKRMPQLGEDHCFTCPLFCEVQHSLSQAGKSRHGLN
jgi:hypothetical protein